MDRSRHTVTRYLSEEKTHAAINIKLFRQLDHVNNALCEVEIAKAQIEHKESINFSLAILQYSKPRMLKLYYNFLIKYCDVNNSEELDMDNASQYAGLAEKELVDCIGQEMKTEWEKLRCIDSDDNFAADATGIFLPRFCCAKDKEHGKRERGLFK